MVFGDALTKAGRLLELQRLFAKRPERSFSTAEIARFLGIAERTVRQYLSELSASGRLPVILDGRRWRLAPDARIEVPPIRFMLEEASAVYLAARLLCRHSDEPNPAAREAIAKLASVVPADLAAVMEELVRSVPGDAGPFSGVFRAVAYGWALRREIDVEYHALGWDGPRRCRFRPYLIEPSVHGYSLYAIGHADPPGGLRIFKLERMREAALLDTRFEPPPVADLFARISQSWDVWFTDGDAIEVRMRFDPRVARRVTEARWHSSQRVTELPGGGVELRLAVSSTVELLPWILGWGDACEVLEPADLRDAVAAELARASARYTPRHG
ncbi:MAG: helix-turn-helix transcriptional regulator [Acidobacteriota bacterium]